MSEVKVDKISPADSSANTTQIGDSGDTISLPSGVTLTVASGLGVASGGTGLTSFTAGDLLYATGATTLAKLAKGSAAQILKMNSGASAPEWDNADAGGIEWQSSIVTASTLNAVAGKAYWINTTSNACTITLPGSASVGDEVIFADYLRTWNTNSVTINQNSLKFQGLTSPNPVYSGAGQSIHIVYSGATQGWIPNSDQTVANKTRYNPEIMVIGGGGAGGFTDTGYAGGGGGSGGISYHSAYPAMTAGDTFAIVVGSGGARATSDSQMTNDLAPAGSNSTFGSGSQTILTAFGGGGGAGHDGGGYKIGGSGGSGGGSEAQNTMGSTGAAATQGTGGTKHYGNAGGSPGSGTALFQASGGGGAGAAPGRNYNGGAGTSDFSDWGSATSTGHNSGGTYYYAAGGSGGIGQSGGTPASTVPNGGGGTGGDGSGSSGGDGIDGTGSGGGGRGKWNAGSGHGGAGGDGIVIIKRLTSASSTTSGSVHTSGLYTYHVFTANGTYTA